MQTSRTWINRFQTDFKSQIDFKSQNRFQISNLKLISLSEVFFFLRIKQQIKVMSNIITTGPLFPAGGSPSYGQGEPAIPNKVPNTHCPKHRVS